VTEEELQKKRLIRNIIDNPLFESILNDIKVELGLAMLDEDNELKRLEIRSLSRALDRLVGHLTAIANEVKVESN